MYPHGVGVTLRNVSYAESDIARAIALSTPRAGATLASARQRPSVPPSWGHRPLAGYTPAHISAPIIAKRLTGLQFLYAQ